MNARLQNLIILLGVLILAYLGYYLYSNSSNASLNAGGSIASEAAAESASFLRRLNDIKTIDLDDSLFSDPRFQSLEDNTLPLTEVPTGRANPFAAVEDASN